jgi:hypothetical protein
LTFIDLSGIDDPRVRMPTEWTPHPPITFPFTPDVAGEIRAATHGAAW